MEQRGTEGSGVWTGSRFLLRTSMIFDTHVNRYVIYFSRVPRKRDISLSVEKIE